VVKLGRQSFGAPALRGLAAPKPRGYHLLLLSHWERR
jgi:hypothetical protein